MAAAVARLLCGLLLCLGAAHAQRPTYPDLTGAYCAARTGARPMQCCSARDDPCSVSILGTLCYCDEFCDRGATGDCCPDYFRFCRNESQPQPVLGRDCKFNGGSYSYGDHVRDNCNVCTCTGDSAAPEMRCGDHACLVDPVLIQVLNQDPEMNGWVASNYSHFWGMALSQGERYLLGTDYPTRLMRTMYPVTKTPMPLPEWFDARQRWPGLVGGVVDQGWCGASWAVSTTSVASDRFSIQRGFRTDLSIQNVLDCADPERERKCDGGGLDKAWNYLRLERVAEASCYPYRGGASEACLTAGRQFTLFCRNNRTFVTSERAQLLGVQPSYRIAGERDIMQEILTNGPVQAIVRVQRDMFLYRSGVYRATSNRDARAPYHSVRVLGWGVQSTRVQSTGADSSTADSRDGRPHLTKYWLVANSWGRRWGEDGLMRIRRGTNEADIEAFVVGAWGFVHPGADDADADDADADDAADDDDAIDADDTDDADDADDADADADHTDHTDDADDAGDTTNADGARANDAGDTASEADVTHT